MTKKLASEILRKVVEYAQRHAELFEAKRKFTENIPDPDDRAAAIPAHFIDNEARAFDDLYWLLIRESDAS